MYYLGNLLKKYINIEDNPEKIAKNLTLKTCEVENIRIREIPDTIVIGKVLEVQKHPNADKLFVCNIDCGNYGKYQIITGGENIVNSEGSYVPVALPGTFLPELNVKIVSRNMRGIESNGMICSKSELGIPEDEDKHWIWLLNEDFDDLSDEDVGKSLKYKYPWLENWILDVDNKTITHRPDLTGHFGLAVELNSIYNNTGKIKFNKLNDYFKTFDNTNIFDVLQNSTKSDRVLNVITDKCYSYILLQLDNIDIKNSDFFLRTLMYDLGVSLHNNWVDFSNIFMFLTGQPIHFFDADKVKGNIIVRNAVNGEEFVDLNGNKYTLSDQDIVIADEEKILALAGIIGSNNSCVDENTKNILVEIANFDPVSIRKTGLRLGLRTDAELRFEKGISPLWSLYSLILFLDEIKYFKKDLGNYTIGGLDFYYKNDIFEYKNRKIKLDFSQMSNFIFGENVEGFDNKAKNILTNLGFKFKDNNLLIIPIWRGLSDINIEEDIYEEVARIYGYENINGKVFNSPTEYVKYLDFVDMNRKLEEIFVRDLSFDQVETYPWVDEDLIDLFGVDKENLLSLINPTAPKFKYLRDTLFFSLLEVIQKNFRNFDNIKIFEIGKVWKKSKEVSFEKFDIENLKLYNIDYYIDKIDEKTKIGFMIYKSKVNNWKEDPLVDAKKYINVFLKRLDIKGKKQFVKTNSKWFHPVKQGRFLLNGINLGFLGQLHPIWYDYFKFKETSQIFYGEIDFSSLLKIYLNQKKGIKISKYDTSSEQILWKDLSFLIDKNEDYGKIIDAIKKVKEVDEVKVFDLYIGDNIPQNKKSITISVKIKGEGLTSNDINKIFDKIISEVNNVGGRLR